jgi:predicted Zn-dependent protease
MAHTAMRHATHLMSLGTLMQMGLDTLPENLPSVIPVSASMAIPIVMAQNARKCELQADALAITVLTAAGYNPRVLIDYIRTLPPEPHRASMPDPALRISRLEAALAPKP